MSTSADALPRLLDGRYRLEGELGRGGMGVVHRGTQLALDRPVAIKLLLGDAARDPAAVERFRREALAASHLSHPGIVGVVDCGVDAGVPFLVMELVDGETLDARLERMGALSIEDALAITRQLAEALAAAHRAGILHRDVKPANAIVADDGRVRLLDFGLASLAEHGDTRLTRHGAIVGTPDYLAPELALGAAPDARMDVYALGATLHELLTGVVPFARSSPMATLLAHLQDDRPRPSARDPRIPPHLDALVARLMAREPDERPADAGLALVELQKASEALVAPADALAAHRRTPSRRDVDAQILAAFARDGRREPCPPSPKPKSPTPRT